LPALLHYGDAVSMMSGVELRQPFLDHRLVEWAFTVPPDVKIRHGQNKWVLREYLRRNGMNYVNGWRKEGYTTPLPEWIRKDAGRIKGMLSASQSASAARMRPGDLDSLMTKAVHGNKTAAYHVFRLLTLELWLESV
jgi:asparagine synthase (glutamine-hydrolysing)